MISTLTEKLEEIKRFYPLINDEEVERRPSALQADFDAMLDTAVTILDMIKDGCDLIPPAFVKPAVNLACGLLKAVKKTRTNYEDMQDLSAIVSEFVLSIAIFCNEHHIQLTKGFERALSNFTNVLRKIVEKCTQLANTSLVSRFLQQGRDSDTLVRMKAELQQAVKEFQLKTQILQHSDFHGFSRVINDKLDGDVIKGLPENPFFEGTREDFIPEIQDDILKQIAAWIESSSSPILWLCGGAGFGKSSISHQLVYHLMDTGRLAAQMFFTRGSVMQRNIVTVIQTLARELASMHPKTVPDIASATRLGGSSHEELSAYLKRYLLAPIQALGLPRSMVIVLDALDECDNHQLLFKAFEEIADFSGIKIFIASRPEASIEHAMDTLLVEKVALKRVSQAKMENYFYVRFAKMSWPNQHPSSDDISEMAKLADGVLIWAATSCNFIENDLQDDDSYHLLQNILSAGKARDIASDDQLSSLYRTTLTHLFGPKHVHNFRKVFQAMLVCQVPMAVEVFAKTFDLGIRQARAVHSALFALQIYETLDKEVILPATQRFHSSFLEYITNDQLHSLSNQFYINPSFAHATIAQVCLSRIPDIDSCFHEGQAWTYRNLEKHIQYATGYWPFHLTRSVLIQELPPHQANDALNQLAHEGMRIWTPFHLLVSQALSQTLEGPGSRNAIDTAISFHHHSLQLFTATGITQTDASSDFGFAIWKRYEQSGFYKDLEDSISMHSQFLDSHSTPSLQRAQALFRLGLALRARFNTPQSSNDDLDNTISTLKEAYELYSTLHIQHYQSLSTLASTLRIRFEETGVAKDLDDAIATQTQAVEMAVRETAQTTDIFDLTRARNNLATCFLNRFEETNDGLDLDKAISILYSILQGRPAGHPFRPSTLNNIAFSLQRRYQQSGKIQDLNDAIAMHYDVLESRPAPHQFRAQTLANLAQCLRHRFEVTGSFTALDEAIAKDSEALELRPSSHPYHLISLNRLGTDFYTHFIHSGNYNNLVKAISNIQKVVELCPESHREFFYFLSAYGNALRTRFEEKGDQQDLADAVDMQRRSQKLCPPGSLEFSNILHNLGATLLIQYELNQSQETLTEAINLHREALELRPGSHPRRFESLNNLAKGLHYQFKLSKTQNSLAEALALYNEAFSLCAASHPSHPTTVEGLANVLYSRFELDNCPEDLDRSISMYEELLIIDSSSIVVRSEMVMRGLTTALRARKLKR
ncbi:hypothetical protein BJ912DRAFT_873664 [Pholiota molesta]|nr:hypothetical protein BJ912DRAFT_873664 [Pholiota molesta]